MKCAQDSKNDLPPLPNISFNPGPTVRDYRHALDFWLSVGPVNFVRQALFGIDDQRFR